jgi:methyltransferase-like protein
VPLEQYMDFLRNRTFRQTILCRAERRPNYQVTPERLQGLHVASPVRPAVAGADPRSGEEAVFEGPGGARVSSRQPLVKAALAVLADEWPRTVPFSQLVVRARERLRDGPLQDGAALVEDARALGRTLWDLYAAASTALVELWTRPVVVAGRPGQRPVARPLARWQAAGGRPHVTNLRHEVVHVNPVERCVLRQLDGSRSAEDVLGVLADLAAAGEITVARDGQRAAEPAGVRAALREALGQILNGFARNSLLV